MIRLVGRDSGLIWPSVSERFMSLLRESMTLCLDGLLFCSILTRNALLPSMYSEARAWAEVLVRVDGISIQGIASFDTRSRALYLAVFALCFMSLQPLKTPRGFTS